MKRIYILIILICVCLAGCRSHRAAVRHDRAQRDTTATTTPTTEAHPERLDTLMNANYSTLSANFECKVRGIDVSGQLRMGKDEIVWVSISKIIELGRAQLTPSRVQAYIKLAGKKYDLSYADIKRQWGIDADFATLQALLTANCPPQCRSSKEPQRDGDEVTLWYTQAGTRQLTLKKDYATKRITAATLQSNGQQIELTYSNWTTIDGQLIPTTINVVIKSKQLNEQTAIKLERITLNQKQSYPFKM